MPMANSSRLVLACWWLAVIVLMNTFSGTLKASMLIKDDADKIQTVRDLASSKRINVFVWKGTAYEALIKDSPAPEFQKIWNKVLENNGTLPLGKLFNEEMMKDVQLSKRVVISDLPTMKYAISSHCVKMKNGEFYISKQEFFGHTLGMAVSKNFNDTLLRQINKRIRWMVESKLVDRWVNEQYGALDRCAAGESSEHQTLHMSDLVAIFYLWSLCLAISIGVVFLEIASVRGCKAALLDCKHNATTRKPPRTTNGFPQLVNTFLIGTKWYHFSLFNFKDKAKKPVKRRLRKKYVIPIRN